MTGLNIEIVTMKTLCHLCFLHLRNTTKNSIRALSEPRSPQRCEGCNRLIRVKAYEIIEKGVRISEVADY